MNQTKPPANWNTINPEVTAIGSTEALLKQCCMGLFFLIVGINSVLRNFLSFGLATGITVLLFICGFLFLRTFVSNTDKEVTNLRKYLSWIFATTPGEKRTVLIRSDPKLAAHKKVVEKGILLVAEIFGKNEQLQHKLVIAIAHKPANLELLLNVLHSCDVHYDPETLEPAVIDFGTWRGWRLPAFQVN